MENASTVLAVVGVALTLCSVVAGGWAVSRAAAIKATLDTVIVGNSELRTLNEELRAELVAEKALRVEDKAHARAEIARLEGQMQLLTGHLGEQIAAAVVRSLPQRDQSARTRKDDN